MAKNYPRKISQDTVIPFSVNQEGFFCIILSARCGANNQASEDLRVELDGVKFREIPSKDRPQYQNIPPSWNGAKLKGLSKQVIIITRLLKGEHKLTFVPRGLATIEQEPIVQPISNSAQVSLDMEIRAEDGDCRPWVTLALVDLPLLSISVDITARWRFRDSDDVKMIVDNEIKKNVGSILHKNWTWSGGLIKRLFGKERQEKIFVENLRKDNHYIEFWADRMPILHRVVLDLGYHGEEGGVMSGKIALYSDIEQTDFVRVRKEPAVSSQELGKLNNGEAIIILEKNVKGDYVMNKSNIWHKVKYNGKIGFIMSSFVEIDGEERAAVTDKIKKQARVLGVDVELAVAVAECESQFKPYAVSSLGALGIFQLTSIARGDLRKRFNFNISEEDSFNVDKNIEAGLIYLRWLTKVYEGSPDQHKKIIAAWNAGKSLIPIESRLSLKNIVSDNKRAEVERLMRCVEEKMADGEKGKQSIVAIIAILVLIASVGLVYITPRIKGYIFGRQQIVHALDLNIARFEFYYPFEGVDSIRVTNNSVEPMIWRSEVDYVLPDRGWRKDYPGFLENAYLFDIDFDGTPELFVVRGEGKQIMTNVIKYVPENKSFIDVRFVDANGHVDESLCCSPIIYTPLSNGVQYDLGINVTEKNKVRQIVYKYNFLKRVFEENRD